MNRRLRVGRYVLHGEIAAGGMATVHVGRLEGEAGFARAVAIKRLHPQFAKDPEFVDMLLDEARLASRIHHPNVVATLDVVAREGELFVVMEYVEGESLSRLLRTLHKHGEPVPLPIAIAIATGLLSGLHAAHEARDDEGAPLDIVHRDVSPQNVLVGVDGVARVLDFGVAKAASRAHATRDGQVKGKLAYMAPEQLSNGLVDRRADVFAAGIVIWEMLTCTRLFLGDSQAATAGNVLGADVDPPSAKGGPKNAALDAVVLRALAREPSRRFATARQMASALEEAAGPAAGATQIGEWVRSVADEALAQRSRTIASMDNAPPEPASEPPSVAPPEISTIAIARPMPPPERRKPWTIIGAFGGGAVVAGTVFIGATLIRPAPASSIPAATASDAPADAPPSASADVDESPPATSASAAPRVHPAPPKKKCAVRSFADATGVKHYYEDCGHK